MGHELARLFAMVSVEKSIRVYEDLARCYDRHGQVQVRDRFLVLAADAALSAGKFDQAEQLRADLLRRNPHHMLKPFPSLPQAMQSPDFKNYLEGLRRSYPRENIEHLLETVQTGKDEDWLPQAMPVSPPVQEPAVPYSFKDQIGAEPRSAPSNSTGSSGSDITQPVPRVPVHGAPSIPTPGQSAYAVARSAGDEAAFTPAPQSRPPSPRRAPSTSFSMSTSATPNRSEQRDKERAVGRWVADGLFLLVLVGGLLLLVYTLAKPFLSPPP